MGNADRDNRQRHCKLQPQVDTKNLECTESREMLEDIEVQIAKGVEQQGAWW